MSEDAVDPMVAMQNTLSDIGGEAMCIGYACVVEWLEPDGSSSIQVLHTDMAPWHLRGLLEWGTEMATGFVVDSTTLLHDGDDDDF
jgi:hypothetical protein